MNEKSWSDNFKQYKANGSCGCCPDCNSSNVEAIDREAPWTSVTFKCHDCGSWDHFDEGYPDLIPTHPYFTNEEMNELIEGANRKPPKKKGIASPCLECIAYLIHHELADLELCDECGQKALIWKQDRGGTFYLECSNCGCLVAVDLNTPCEEDRMFQERIRVFIEPLREILSNRTILDVSKYFHINALQMREKLTEGFSVEKELRDKGEFDELIDLLKRSGIPYKIVEPDDPRKKYTYYRKCGYPYSPMRVYLKTEKQF